MGGTTDQISLEDSNFFRYPPHIVGIIIAANILPVIGLLFFGWGLIEILVVYWFEGVVALVVLVVKGLSAELIETDLPHPRSEPQLRTRPGSIQFGPLEFNIRNCSHAGAAIMFLSSLLAVGILLFYPASPLLYSSSETVWSTAVVATTLALTHILTAGVYFRQQRHQLVTPKQISGSALRVAGIVIGSVVLLWMGGATADESEIQTLPAFVAYLLVVGKTGLVILFQCRDRDRFIHNNNNHTTFTNNNSSQDGLDSLVGIDTTTLPEISAPAAIPQHVIKPDARRLIVFSPVIGVFISGAQLVFLLIALVIFVFGDPVFALVPFVAALIIGSITTFAYVISRHATIEYHFYNDQLVCYDSLVEKSVWKLSYEVMLDVDIKRGVSGRVAGHGHIVVETETGPPARLLYLSEYEDAAGYLRRQINNRAKTRQAPD